MKVDDQAITYNYFKILGQPLKKSISYNNFVVHFDVSDVIQPHINLQEEGGEL